VACLLSACVYVPRTVEVRDPECGVVSRQMRLELEQVAYVSGCRNESCALAVAGAGVVGAASAVVSGSIVLVGNMLYWLEKQGRCLRATP
jgi:hypothetical protein